MASKQIHLFATRRDIEPTIRLVEGKSRLKYALCGLFSSRDIRLYSSLLECESLGRAAGGNHSLCDEFLVLDVNAELKIRDVPQRLGAAKYAVDQLWNPVSICFRPGGLFGDEFLICGRIGTASDHPDAVQLFREFSRSITREFRKHRDYYVGPEAFTLRQKGVRLITMHVDEAKEYDLDFS
jgi:hypothetical protein